MSLYKIASKANTKIALFLFLSFCLQPNAYSGMVSNHDLFGTHSVDRQRLVGLLDREDIRDQLVSLGVEIRDAQQRVAMLTDDEVKIMLADLESMPAGQSFLGTLAFVFIVLLITDILGYTNIFPFVNHPAPRHKTSTKKKAAWQ